MRSKKNWKIEEQAKLYLRLGSLLEKGYSLTTALEFLMLYISNDKKKDLEFILLQLKQGSPFYSVFDRMQFAKDGLSYIYFAENQGDLAKGLVNAGKMLEMKEGYKKKTIKVLRYPLFLLVLLLFVILMMQQILLPQFIQLYQSLNLPQSPILTCIIFIKSTFPIIISWLLLILVTISFSIFFNYRKKSSLEKHTFLCKFPFVKYVLRKYNTYFFAFHFGNLLANGLAINEVLTIFEKQGHIPFFQEEAKRIREFLIEGNDLENILKDTLYYDKELATIIFHGQVNGILAKELLDYSILLLDELEEKFTMWLRILQPMMMLLVGIVVVSLYLAVMLPIYGTIQTL